MAAEPFWAELRDRLGRRTATRQLTHGPSRGLWSYEFDVQTRWAHYRAGSANAIATVIAARGCLDAARMDEERQVLLGQALLRCFWRGTYFAYTPDSDVLIHNANLLVASLAARLACDGRLDASLSEALRHAATTAVATTLAAQRPDGSWPYGEGHRLEWIDGYHTAYSLLALEDATTRLGQSAGRAAIEQGARYYFERLFDGAVPRFLAGPRPGRSDVNNVATGLRAAVWGASQGFTSADFPGHVLTVLQGFWNPRRHYVQARADNRWPAARLDYPRWGAAPALDALTAMTAWSQEERSQ